MKAVILAAGYATRLYPLTHDAPKHLLEVGGRPILDRLLEQLPLEELDTVYVITNAKFADRFREWADAFAAARVEVIDDGTTSEDDKLGAIGDLALAIEQKGIDDDLLIAAGDSLFTERLDGIAQLRPGAGRLHRLRLRRRRPRGDSTAELARRRRRGPSRLVRREAGEPDVDARGNRALLLPAELPAARDGVPRGGKQP